MAPLPPGAELDLLEPPRPGFDQLIPLGDGKVGERQVEQRRRLFGLLVDGLERHLLIEPEVNRGRVAGVQLGRRRQETVAQ